MGCSKPAPLPSGELWPASAPPTTQQALALALALARRLLLLVERTPVQLLLLRAAVALGTGLAARIPPVAVAVAVAVAQMGAVWMAWAAHTAWCTATAVSSPESGRAKQRLFFLLLLRVISSHLISPCLHHPPSNGNQLFLYLYLYFCLSSLLFPLTRPPSNPAPFPRPLSLVTHRLDARLRSRGILECWPYYSRNIN